MNPTPLVWGMRHDAIMVDDFQTFFNWQIAPWGQSIPSAGDAPDLLYKSIAIQIT
jgi:hypothetical protein